MRRCRGTSTPSRRCVRRLNFDLHTGLPYLSLFAPSYRVYKTLARQILVDSGTTALELVLTRSAHISLYQRIVCA